MGSLTADDAIKAHLDGKKTPYQLDLEVMDRKPNIVPRVGDKVKIKSLEWLEKWSKMNGSELYVPLNSLFFYGYGAMPTFCGDILTVTGVDGNFFKLDDSYGFSWTLEMFEEVYPAEEQLSSKFPKIDLVSPYLYQSPYEVKGSITAEVNRSYFAVKVEETTKRLAAYSLVQGMAANPKLKQVKTTRLIKLKKL